MSHIPKLDSSSLSKIGTYTLPIIKLKIAVTLALVKGWSKDSLTSIKGRGELHIIATIAKRKVANSTKIIVRSRNNKIDWRISKGK